MRIYHAEYIPHRGDYRLYEKEYPQQTVAYVEKRDDIIKWADEDGDKVIFDEDEIK